MRRIRLAFPICLVFLTFAIRLRADPGYGIPVRTDSNIIVASYNIKWLGEASHDLAKLARVIENFDVCGIIEVKRESEVRELAKALKARTNKDWGYIYGLRTHRPRGNYHEAYAAVWRRDRVQLGDGLVSNLWDRSETYRNDPLFVSFKRGNFDFTLLLVHTRWSNDSDGDRNTEVAALVDQLSWIRSFLPERDIILAGDFNYSGGNSVMEQMAEQAGLTQLDANVASTFKRDGSGYASSYDHIYISSSDTTEYAGQCGVLDVTALVYGSNTKQNMKSASTELSDHLPVWACFTVTGADDD